MANLDNHPGVIVASRSFENLYGKPVVGIGEALKVAWQMAGDGQLFGIINADIYPSPIHTIAAELDAIRHGEAHVFCRRDIYRDPKTGEISRTAVYGEGIDLIVMRKGTWHPEGLVDESFAFGVPWWDLWVPLCLLNQKVPVIVNLNGAIWHEWHEQRYSHALWQSQREVVVHRLLPTLRPGLRREIERLSDLIASSRGPSDSVVADAMMTLLRCGEPKVGRRILRAGRRYLRLILGEMRGNSREQKRAATGTGTHGAVLGDDRPEL
jgi:hypothetical protein